MTHCLVSNSLRLLSKLVFPRLALHFLIFRLRSFLVRCHRTFYGVFVLTNYHDDEEDDEEDMDSDDPMDEDEPMFIGPQLLRRAPNSIDLTKYAL